MIDIHILATQSYGYINDPDDHSPGAEGSRNRINDALRVVLEKNIPREQCLAVFPQGYNLDNPEPEPLCESLKRYFMSRTEANGIRVIAKPLGWSTYKDVKNVDQILFELGISSKNIRIHFVSDPVHLRRLKIMWRETRRFLPASWSAEFHKATTHRMSWYERNIREPIA